MYSFLVKIVYYFKYGNDVVVKECYSGGIDWREVMVRVFVSNFDISMFDINDNIWTNKWRLLVER